MIDEETFNLKEIQVTNPALTLMTEVRMLPHNAKCNVAKQKPMVEGEETRNTRVFANLHESQRLNAAQMPNAHLCGPKVDACCTSSPRLQTPVHQQYAS